MWRIPRIDVGAVEEGEAPPGELRVARPDRDQPGIDALGLRS